MSNFSYDEKLNNSTYTSDDFSSDIVLEVIKLREKKGITQVELARKAGVEVNEIKNFERFNFDELSFISFSKILYCLGVKPEFVS